MDSKLFIVPTPKQTSPEPDFQNQLRKFDEKLYILDALQRSQIIGQLKCLEMIFLKKEFNYVEKEKKQKQEQGQLMRSLSSSFKVVRAFVSEKIKNKSDRQWESIVNLIN